MGLAGMQPDAWQTTFLRSCDPRTLLLCSRQSGKSQTAAALAIKTAVLEVPALILILSPSLRQSGELYRAKLLPLLRGVLPVVEVVQETKLQLELSNGSRIVSLPENEIGIRGYSGVSLLIIDEAARVSDGLYLAVRPMLAVSRGRLIALSTPYGKRGWFYDEWQSTHRGNGSALLPTNAHGYRRSSLPKSGRRWGTAITGKNMNAHSRKLRTPYSVTMTDLRARLPIPIRYYDALFYSRTIYY